MDSLTGFDTNTLLTDTKAVRDILKVEADNITGAYKESLRYFLFEATRELDRRGISSYLH